MSTVGIVSRFFSLVMPAICSNLLFTCMASLNYYYIGKLDDAAIIAGVGLAQSIMTVIGSGLMVGCNCAQETLTSQAFGAGELVRCGVLLNRGRAVLTTIFIPLSVAYYFSEPIFHFIGQDPQVSFYAGKYMRSMILSTYLHGNYDLTKRFLYQMQVTWAPMLATIVGTLLHAYWLNLFIIEKGYGIEGLPYANTTTNLILFTTVTVISHVVPRLRESLFCPTIESFRDWGEYFSIAVPVTIMLCAEWWAFEIFNIASGYLSVNTQAAQVILWNFLLLIY
jgi:MATE family multidrug resistance protein